MPHIINNLKPINDEYSTDMVSCFQKPIQMAFSYFDNDYSCYYLMLTKLVESYNIDKYNMNNIYKILKIKLNANNDENIYDSIKKEIDKDNPVLVTGDLYGLYYTDNYLLKHWPHLFLIKGYDELRKIYFIIDGCQADVYGKFAMPFDILDNLYNIYKGQGKGIYSYNKLDDKKVYNIDVLSYFINIYLNCLSKQPYKEIDIINVMCMIIQREGNLFNLQDYPNKLLNTLKYKKVMYAELIKCLSSTELISEDIIDELKSLSQTMYNNLCQYFTKKIKCLYKKEAINIDDISHFINDNELKIRSLISKCNDIIVKDGNKISHSEKETKTDDNFIIINNKDKLINIKSINKVEFNYNTNKTYFFWLEDNCPRVYIKKQFNSTEKFKFSVNLKITDGFKETDFQAGIFILTKDEHLYCWGSYSGITLRATHLSTNKDLFDYVNNSLDDNLFVIIENNKCKLGYYNKEEKKDCIVHEIELTDNVKNIGFGCRTFGNGELLNISFEDYKLESL